MLISKIVYLNTVALNDRCEETLRQLQYSNYRGVDLKKLPGHQIWSIRTSDAGRLLLSQITLHGEVCWLILEHLPSHDYEKARFLKPNVLQRFLEKNQNLLNAVTESHFRSVESNDDDDDNDKSATPASLHRVHYYNQEYISLNHAQQEIITQQLPLVISGMPGSGKTCIGFVLLENFIKLNKESGGCALYISLSSTLTANMKKLWGDNEGMVEFVSIQELIQQDATLVNMRIVEFSHFHTWYQDRKLAYAPAAVYEEFKCIGVAKNLDDYIEQSGTRNSLFHDANDKKVIYSLYQNYLAYLSTNNLLDLYFYDGKVLKQYDFIFVDEAQNLSHLQLRHCLAAAREQQICFAMDTNQNMQKGVSTRPYLLQLISQNSHQKVRHFNLLQTFRNPPSVVELANAVLHIKNVLVGGVADTNEYTQTIAEKNTSQPGLVQWYSQVQADIIANADHVDCAIVVNDLDAKQRAQQLFLNHPLIFTREEIQGLQFGFIILFEPLADPVFHEMNKLIPDDLQSRTLKQHRPKDKHDQSALAFVQSLNALFTSITRSSHMIYIISAETHHNKKIHQHLQQSTVHFASNPVVIPQSSTEEQWAAKAQELEENNKIEQARAIRKLIIKAPKASQQATSATKSNVVVSDADLVEDFISLATPEKFRNIIRSPNFSKLFYATKGRAGVSIFEVIKKSIRLYLPLFLQVNEALSILTILARDKAILKQIILPRDNFFTDKVLGKYSQSACGSHIIRLTFDDNVPLMLDINKTSTSSSYFWSQALNLAKYEDSRFILFAACHIKQPSQYFSLTKTVLFSTRLFQAFAQHTTTRQLLHSVLERHPSWFTDFPHELLYSTMERNLNVFQHLSSCLHGQQVLTFIFKNNPNLFKEFKAEYLFTKQVYSNESQLIPSQICSSAFLTVIVSAQIEGMELLQQLLKLPEVIKAITAADLFEAFTADSADLCAAHYFLIKQKIGSSILHFIFVNRPDILSALPARTLFTPLPWLPSTAPIAYDLMRSDNLPLLRHILLNRSDIVVQFIEFLGTGGLNYLELLNGCELGKQIIKFLHQFRPTQSPARPFFQTHATASLQVSAPDPENTPSPP